MHDLIMRTVQAVAQAAMVPVALWALRQLWRLWLQGVVAMGKATEIEYLTAAEAAKRLRLRTIEVTRTYERGFMAPAKRLGRIRMIPVGDLPVLKEAAKKAGYPAGQDQR